MKNLEKKIFLFKRIESNRTFNCLSFYLKNKQENILEFCDLFINLQNPQIFLEITFTYLNIIMKKRLILLKFQN